MYLGEGKNPTKEHLRKLGKKHGLKKAQNIMDEVKRSVGMWGVFAKEANVSKKLIKEIAEHLGKI